MGLPALLADSSAGGCAGTSTGGCMSTEVDASTGGRYRGCAMSTEEQGELNVKGFYHHSLLSSSDWVSSIPIRTKISASAVVDDVAVRSR